MGKRKIDYQGRQVEGEDVPFRIVQDGAVIIETDDGAKLRVRPVVVNVIKTGEKAPDGDRLYILQHIVHIVLDTPPKEDQ